MALIFPTGDVPPHLPVLRSLNALSSCSHVGEAVRRGPPQCQCSPASLVCVAAWLGGPADTGGRIALAMYQADVRGLATELLKIMGPFSTDIFTVCFRLRQWGS